MGLREMKEVMTYIIINMFSEMDMPCYFSGALEHKIIKIPKKNGEQIAEKRKNYAKNLQEMIQNRKYFFDNILLMENLKKEKGKIKKLKLELQPC